MMPGGRRTDSRARYEFRCWPKDSASAVAALDVQWEDTGRTTSRETYLLLPGASDRLVKLRSGALDVKRRLQCLHGLEQWTVQGHAPFPIDGAQLSGLVIDSSALPPSGWGHGWLFTSAHACIGALQSAYPDLRCPRVGKLRRRYRRGACLAEYTRVTTAWGRFATLAVEADDAQDVLSEVARLGQDGLPNLNYGVALARLCATGRGADLHRGPSDCP